MGWEGHKSNKSLLANDLSTSMQAPSLWNYVQIRSPKYQAAGVSIAGLPTLLSGFNGKVAWSMSQVSGDTQDVFLEKVKRELEHAEGTGPGLVYSFTVNRTGRAEHPAYQQAPVYVLAYVQLAEGPRVLTNVVDIDPDDVRVDLPVRAVFHRTDGELGLVRFAPDDTTC
jgi:hypothetical protein